MRLLVIEDEPNLLDLLAKTLRAAGYAVDVAADGEEGLFKAESWDYDAIVLDLMLPKRNGFEVLTELRRTRRTPVLILTARDSTADKVQGLDLGSDDYLVKPFKPAELLARLRALIRRAAGQANPQLALGDIVIDTASRVVMRGSERIPLTAREYGLVEFLALRRGELVTRTMLYEHLLNEDDDSLSNLMEVHVSNVRKKLGRDFIVTRRGQGYMIDE